jgi:hypothetical protein
MLVTTPGVASWPERGVGLTSASLVLTLKYGNSRFDIALVRRHATGAGDVDIAVPRNVSSQATNTPLTSHPHQLGEGVPPLLQSNPLLP